MERTDLPYLQRLFDAFYEVGALPGGGVTRLGYTELEDEMHRRFADLAKELDCMVETDLVGNSYAYYEPAEEHVLIGSHLDSVIQGGRYDGVAGVMAGLLLLKRARENRLSLPLKVAAFRCEESSNFGCCTMGSGLVTHQLREDPDHLAKLAAKNGETLGDVFARRGLSLTPPNGHPGGRGQHHRRAPPLETAAHGPRGTLRRYAHIHAAGRPLRRGGDHFGGGEDRPTRGGSLRVRGHRGRHPKYAQRVERGPRSRGAGHRPEGERHGRPSPHGGRYPGRRPGDLRQAEYCPRRIEAQRDGSGRHGRIHPARPDGRR